MIAIGSPDAGSGLIAGVLECSNCMSMSLSGAEAPREVSIEVELRRRFLDALAGMGIGEALDFGLVPGYVGLGGMIGT